jgi:hypothetical protein
MADLTTAGYLKQAPLPAEGISVAAGVVTATACP